MGRPRRSWRRNDTCWIRSNSDTSNILEELRHKEEEMPATGHLAKVKDMLGLEAFDKCITFVPLSHKVLLPFLHKDIEAHTS